MRNASGIQKLLGAMLALTAWLGTEEVRGQQPDGLDDTQDNASLLRANCPPDFNPAATPPRCPWYVRSEGVMFLRDTGSRIDFAALGSPTNIVLSTRDLDFPFKAGARMLLGRTINPWNQIEFSYFGVEHWDDTEAVRNLSPNAIGGLGNLFSPFTSFGRPAVVGLDYENFVSISAKSTFDNAEINWRHILDMPPGRLSTSLLVGARYMQVREHFQYDSALSIPGDSAVQNIVRTDTSNKLFGVQLGALLEFYSEGSWWVNFEMKGAMAQNDGAQTTDFRNIQAAGTTEFLGHRDGRNTAWIGDIALTVLYRFSPRLNARFGYQAIWVTGLNLATENFDQDINLLREGPALLVHHRGSVVYHGPFAGIEFAW
jgi:hypothetical protein